MQTFRAIIVNALFRKHRNSETMLKFLKSGQLSIVDEDKELAERHQFGEERGRNVRRRRQHNDKTSGCVEWRQRYAIGCADAASSESVLRIQYVATLGTTQGACRRACMSCRFKKTLLSSLMVTTCCRPRALRMSWCFHSWGLMPQIQLEHSVCHLPFDEVCIF